MDFVAYIPWLMLTVLAFWHPHTVIFMVLAGVSLMIGLYTPDMLNGTASTPLGLGIGLMMVVFAFLCLALAYKEIWPSEDA